MRRVHRDEVFEFCCCWHIPMHHSVADRSLGRECLAMSWFVFAVKFNVATEDAIYRDVALGANSNRGV